MFRALVLHLHPKVLPERTLRFTLTFGLGGMSLLLVLLLLGTGVLLLFTYEPSVEGAYPSVAALRTDVPLGQFFRNLHRWGANLALILVFLHLLRVVFTGALHGPRRGNWLVGLGLLALVAASNFTGYLLPWDQVSYWAVTISTGMLDYVPGIGGFLQRALRGGDEVGRRTLSNFFVLHSVFIPVFLVALMAVHFWLVRKARGVVIPRSSAGEAADRGAMVPASPNLTVREGVAALVLMAALAVVSLLADAPLADPANPGLSPNPAKAPWYFMGFQELLIHFHPFFAVVVFPLLGGVLLVRAAKTAASGSEGVWFVSPGGRRLAGTAAFLGAALTLLAILLGNALPDLTAVLPSWPRVLTGGLAPFLVTLAAAWAVMGLLKRRFGASAEEASTAWFAAVTASFLALTMVGVFFRGEGMALGWPW